MHGWDKCTRQMPLSLEQEPGRILRASMESSRAAVAAAGREGGRGRQHEAWEPPGQEEIAISTATRQTLGVQNFPNKPTIEPSFTVRTVPKSGKHGPDWRTQSSHTPQRHLVGSPSSPNTCQNKTCHQITTF
eukprot:1144463-Pelagomonas_calceolata.AAC.4